MVEPEVDPDWGRKGREKPCGLKESEDGKRMRGIEEGTEG